VLGVVRATFTFAPSYLLTLKMSLHTGRESVREQWYPMKDFIARVSLGGHICVYVRGCAWIAPPGDGTRGLGSGSLEHPRQWLGA
jgi:hypothetical protein